jgi:hypothetical protein
MRSQTDDQAKGGFHFKRFVRETMFCPFCEINEAATRRKFSQGAKVCAGGLQSNPLLRIEGELGRRAEGFHDLMNGVAPTRSSWKHRHTTAAYTNRR